MMKIKRIVASIGAFVALATCAVAADLPVKAAPLPAVPYLTDPFSGLYAGVHLGYGFNTTGLNAISPPTALDLAGSPQGFLGGLHAGLGQRFGNIYAGVEADFDVANLTGSAAIPGIISANSKDDWFGTLRARFGYILVPNVLAYVTAGLAYGDPSDSFVLGNAGGTFSTSAVKTGWAAGAGVDIALTPDGKWIGRVEYLRVDLGSVSVTGGNPATLVTVTTKAQADTIRFGLSYHF